MLQKNPCLVSTGLSLENSVAFSELPFLLFNISLALAILCSSPRVSGSRSTTGYRAWLNIGVSCCVVHNGNEGVCEELGDYIGTAHLEIGN